MKRSIALILLSVLLLFSATACGDDNKDKKNSVLDKIINNVTTTTASSTDEPIEDNVYDINLCYNCGTEIDTGRIYGGYLYCEDCSNSYGVWNTCDGCGVGESGSWITIGSNIFCEGCRYSGSVCLYCGTHEGVTNMYDGEYCCDNCYEMYNSPDSYSEECFMCGTTYEAEYYYYGDFYCWDCYDQVAYSETPCFYCDGNYEVDYYLEGEPCCIWCYENFELY